MCARTGLSIKARGGRVCLGPETVPAASKARDSAGPAPGPMFVANFRFLRTVPGTRHSKNYKVGRIGTRGYSLSESYLEPFLKGEASA